MKGSALILPYAGFTKRAVAFALDFLVIAGYIAVLLGIGISVTLAVGPLEEGSPLLASPIFWDVIAFLFAVLPVIMYFTLQEASATRATWGKQKLGIKVVNAKGERLCVRQAFMRSLVKFLPWQLAHTSLFHIEGWPFVMGNPTPVVMAGLIAAQALVGVYALSLAISKTHRAPYDWVSGAYVVADNRSAAQHEADFSKN
jgi:uncharacterized RDD family membrane protein YckC